MRITLIATLYFIIGYVSATAQYNAIDDINFESGTDGRSMIITYNIAKGVKKLNHVKVYIQQGTSQHFQELKMVSGAINTVNGSGKKTITWRMFDEMGDKPIVDPVFKIEGEEDTPEYVNEKTHVWMEYSFSLSAPIGITFGIVKKFGGYVKAKVSCGYHLNQISKDNQIVASTFKNQHHSRLAFTAGPIFKITNWLYLSGGMGYGQYKSLLKLKDPNDKYSEQYLTVKESKGAEVEAGAIIKIPVVTFSINYNTILFGNNSGSFRDIAFGIGFMF